MAKDYFHGDQWLQKQVEQRLCPIIEEMQKQGKLPAGRIETLRGLPLYKQLFREQANLFRKERAASIKARKAAQAAKAAEELPLRMARGKAWMEEHQTDTDAQLLQHVKQCAAEIGRTPLEKEVLGGMCIRERFGSWALVLHLAELPLRHGMKSLSPATLKQYLQKHQA